VRFSAWVGKGGSNACAEECEVERDVLHLAVDISLADATREVR
jgi:hypothetical protein